jgi:Anti-sigma-K factor rskA, C-terminal
VTQPPDFEQLVGADVETGERARLRRVHALLVQAGPPPELAPDLEAPTLGLTLPRRRPRRVRRRMSVLAAAAAVLALAFLAGYITGNGRGTTPSAEILKLAGTQAAPAALASLQVEPADSAGNWPMRLSVTGLPTLASGSYYEVYLTRGGTPWASCGTFKVSTKGATTVELNAPYRLKHGDSWVVTRQAGADARPGVVVLRPA